MSKQNVLIPFLGTLAEKLEPIGLPVLRAITGFIFIFHGFPKFMAVVSGNGLGGLAGMVGDSGLPFPIVFAYLAMITEFLGGICLILGLYTRLWAFLGAGMMILIVLFVRGVIFGDFTNVSYRDGGYEYDLLLAGALSVIFLYGAGRFSVDEKLKKTF